MPALRGRFGSAWLGWRRKLSALRQTGILDEQHSMIRHAARHARIAIDPAVMLGKPVIRGTRVTVEQVLRELGAGMSVDEVLAAHPRLTTDDIHAAQAFAADWLAEETVALAET